jgi:hypothetical protein
MTFIVLLAFLFIVVGGVVYLVTLYNGLIALKNDIDKAWANIDVLLKQRHDELSKLLDTTKGYMNFERDTLTKITQARSQYQQAVTFATAPVRDPANFETWRSHPVWLRHPRQDASRPS